MERVPMTPEGHAALQAELKHLKEERPKISEEIGTAADHGDLKENAEYHAAREKQGWIEAKIRDLETKLAESEIVDVPKGAKERVVFGVKVKLEDLNSGQEKVYHIVGPHESDVSRGMISITSPLARSMLGKSAGDDVVVQAPGRTMEYEILEILG